MVRVVRRGLAGGSPHQRRRIRGTIRESATEREKSTFLWFTRVAAGGSGSSVGAERVVGCDRRSSTLGVVVASLGSYGSTTFLQRELRIVAVLFALELLMLIIVVVGSIAAAWGRRRSLSHGGE